MNALNLKEKSVFELLQKKLVTGLPPTVREIAKELNIKSTSTVHALLSSLEEKGYIIRDKYNSRAIKIAGVKEVSQIPVLGNVTAGKPILAEEDIEEYIPYQTNKTENVFALKVKGLSMKNAGILDGDIVIADKDSFIKHGDIVVALIEEEATVKRLDTSSGKPILMPENEDFSPIEADNIQMLGKVIGCIRKY